MILSHQRLVTVLYVYIIIIIIYLLMDKTKWFSVIITIVLQMQLQYINTAQLNAIEHVPKWFIICVGSRPGLGNILV